MNALRPPDGRRPQVSQIKAWVRELCHLDDDATVLVSELACHEPGCPPVETVIAVLHRPGCRAQVKLHLPLAEVTRPALEALAPRLLSEPRLPDPPEAA